MMMISGEEMPLLLKKYAFKLFSGALLFLARVGSVIFDLSRPDLPHQVEENFVNILPRFGRSLYVGHFPALGSVLRGFQADLSPVREIAFVADQDKRNGIVTFHAKNLFAKFLAGLGKKKRRKVS